ncbi:MAG: tetratricopeptide repeat protein [Deltaproteobacteria bacterium]|nr:tetratricopeptide repeat protein [Deltaproteobacteria bacterium]
MIMRRYVVLAFVLIWLAGCASGPAKKSDEQAARPNKSTQALRYLAWLEGTVQTDYDVDKKAIQSRLEVFRNSPPLATDVETYLEYLSVLDASDSARADKEIKQFAANHPGEKRLAFLLAVHYLRANKKELAAYYFHQLEKDPHFPWKSLLYNNLGLLALKDGNRILAMDYLDRAIKATPAVAAPFVNLGAIYLHSRSYADAGKLFVRALEIDDDFEDAALGLGGSLEGQGKYEEAHSIYSDFIASHPNALSALYNDSVILGKRLKRQQEASQQLLRYVQRGGKESARAQEMLQSWR